MVVAGVFSPQYKVTENFSGGANFEAKIFQKIHTYQTQKKLSNKVIFALRLPSKCSFTPSKLRFFGLRKP